MLSLTLGEPAVCLAERSPRRVEGLFNSLAVDIVANEGKGIFYAKNKLGMSDKHQINRIETPLFKEIDLNVPIEDRNIPLSERQW